MIIWVIAVANGKRLNTGYALMGLSKSVLDFYPLNKIKTPTLVVKTDRGLYLARIKVFSTLYHVPVGAKVIDLSTGVVIKRLE